MGSVFLVGPMGAGKSAVGRQLARLLDCPFVDTDDEIERRTGVDIPFIFEKEGEAGFRRRESEVIAELVTRGPVVLATGGGAVLAGANRRALSEHGTVVYLHATVEQQYNRTRRGRERPLIATDDPRGTLEALMRTRDPLYRSIADVVVETDGRRVKAVAAEIHRRLEALEPRA